MLTSALQQFGPFCIIIDYSTLFVLNSKTIKSQKRFLYEKFSRKNIFLPRLNSGSFGCRRSSYEDPVKNGVAANSLFLWWRHQWKAEMTHKKLYFPSERQTGGRQTIWGMQFPFSFAKGKFCLRFSHSRTDCISKVGLAQKQTIEILTVRVGYSILTILLRELQRTLRC